MTFSGALTLTDLNDYITPSQVCIKPVEQTNKPTEEKEPGAAETEIHIDGSGSYYEVSTDSNKSKLDFNQTVPGKKLEQAQINLNDCLACSGCITSAESVLITLQSHAEVLNFLESNAVNTNTDPNTADPYKIPVISISPQSVASLATALAASTALSQTQTVPVTPRQILRRLRAFCTQSLGFAHAFDTTFARHVSLQEHIAEFEERKASDMRHRKGEGVAGGDTGSLHPTSDWGEYGLPMLSSSCPGWVCYAEKAHSEMLPFIARTKSPQQVMGTLVKNWMGRYWGKLPHEIYHVTVMPCYDKKLEASRTDFFNDIYSSRDVDCVITTGELELLMREKGWDLSLPVAGELDEESSSMDVALTSSTNLTPRLPHIPELITHAGTSSGSYLHSIIAHIQACSDVPLTLTTKTVRNADYEEFVLRKAVRVVGQVNGVMDDERAADMKASNGAGRREVTGDAQEQGEVVFKGAKCYGFRNLQNVVRKVGRERGVRTASGAAGKLGSRGGKGGRAVGPLRRGRKAEEGANAREEDRGYDYVEVMACPGGCVNGGGQLKPILAPPTAIEGDEMAVDAEGYQRDWEGGGVAIQAPSTTAEVPSTATETPSVASMEVTVLQNARWGDKEWTRQVEEVYWRDVAVQKHREADQLVQRVWDDLYDSKGGVDSVYDRERSRRDWFRTQYRAVENEVIGLAVVW